MEIKSFLDAVITVLKQSQKPMHYEEIARIITETGLKKAANPPVAAAVALSEHTEKFERVARGIYKLKDADMHEEVELAVAEKIKNAIDKIESSEDADEDAAHDGIIDISQQPKQGLIKAYGIRWARYIRWKGDTKLFGIYAYDKTENTGNVVDFSDQIGVYLLHDRERTIYVGRATDSLIKRLFAHTQDRLSARWDSFSWFGFKDIDPETGALKNECSSNLLHGCNHSIDVVDVITACEAILIEGAEPTQNRRGGDGLKDREFAQIHDKSGTTKAVKMIEEVVDLFIREGRF